MTDSSFKYAAACVSYCLSFCSYSLTSKLYSAFLSSFKSEYLVTSDVTWGVEVDWLRLCTAFCTESTSPGIGRSGSSSTGWLLSGVSGSIYSHRLCSLAELLICCFQALYCLGSRKMIVDRLLTDSAILIDRLSIEAVWWLTLYGRIETVWWPTLYNRIEAV